MGATRKGGRTLMLHRAGLDAVADDGTVTFGAMATLDAVIAAGVEPLADRGRRGRRSGDPRAGDDRRQPVRLAGAQAPRGDLQAPLLAMGARVRSAGAGRRADRVGRGLPGRRSSSRLVLSIEVDRPAARRLPHPAPPPRALLLGDGGRRRRGRRDGADRGGRRRPPRGPADERRAGARRRRLRRPTPPPGRPRACEPHDDALASAWYRREVLPVLVTRAIEQLQEDESMELTINGVTARHRRARRSRRCSTVLREEFNITSAKAGCEQGGCGSCTVLVDGAPRRSCLVPGGHARRRAR